MGFTGEGRTAVSRYAIPRRRLCLQVSFSSSTETSPHAGQMPSETEIVRRSMGWGLGQLPHSTAMADGSVTRPEKRGAAFATLPLEAADCRTVPIN